MSPLASQYSQAFNNNCLLDSATWFEVDTPQAQLDLLNNLVVAGDVAETMLLSGETCWQHPGWWPDVWQVLQAWAQHGQLIQLRLVAEWLLSTYPGGIDPDVVGYLAQLAQGAACEVFPMLSCRWPAPPEFYLSHLRWELFETAEFAAMDETATIKTNMVMKGANP